MGRADRGAAPQAASAPARGGRESDRAGAARRDADRLRVHRRRARREGPEPPKLLGRRRGGGPRLALRRIAWRGRRASRAGLPRAGQRRAGPRLAASAAAGLFGRSGGGDSRRAGATTGQVAYLSGSTLYVTNAEGNTIKVTTSPASTVTKTVKADVKGIHPGETVLDHRSRRLKRRDQRRIDTRRRRRRWSRRTVRRLRHGAVAVAGRRKRRRAAVDRPCSATAGSARHA